MRKIGYFLIAAVVLLAGCAAEGLKSGGLRYAEFNSTIPPLNPNQGRIFFYRNPFFLGTPLQPEIKLNSVVIGQSVPGAFFFKDVAGGTQVVSTSDEPDRDLTFTISAKEIRYVRTGLSLESLLGRINPSLVPTEEAEHDLTELRFLPYTPPEVVKPKNPETMAVPPRDEGY